MDGWMRKPPPRSIRSPASSSKASGQGTGSPARRPRPSSTAPTRPPERANGIAPCSPCSSAAGCAAAKPSALTAGHIQQRDGRWVIVDLRGKHGRVRTVPVPAWVKLAVDLWTGGRRNYRGPPAALGEPPRPDHRLLAFAAGRARVVRFFTARQLDSSSPTTSAAPAPNSAAPPAGSWSRFSCCSATLPLRRPKRYLGSRQDLVHA